MPRAVLKVYEKSGLDDFARGLAALGWDLVASGRTAQVLRDAGLQVTPVERLTQDFRDAWRVFASRRLCANSCP